MGKIEVKVLSQVNGMIPSTAGFTSLAQARKNENASQILRLYPTNSFVNLVCVPPSESQVTVWKSPCAVNFSSFNRW